MPANIMLCWLCVIVLVLPSYAQNQGDKAMKTFSLVSPAFQEGEPIPVRYTCEGPDVSPPLEWNQVPEGTKAFALICDDPDAPVGVWVHWVIYNIPSTMKALPEGIAKGDRWKEPIAQGKNDFRFNGYGGPCPPPGKPHRYYFRLYALDEATGFPPGLTKKELLDKIKGHIIGEAVLMGTYQRKK